MKIQNIAAQLFTIRDYIKTPADIARSLQRIRKIGYQAVQVSGMGPIAESELKKILDGEGLVCCVTHEPTGTILDKPQAVIDRLRALDCRFTAIPSPGPNIDNSYESVTRFAEAINRSGKAMHEAGLILTYHNHNGEFGRRNGRLILDIIYDSTDPRYLQSELDTYWVQAGGGNPAAWCKKLTGRLPIIHLKDFGINEQGQQVFREIGNGNLDWSEIIPIAEKAGCGWFIVEQDAHWINNDPFESLRVSFDYLAKHWC
jgi:sugar phosphate isomerase/epimerase